VCSSDLGRAAGTARELAGRTADAAEDSARQMNDLGTEFYSLCIEQTQDGMRATMAIARATNWQEIAQAQREFLAGFERMRDFSERYRAALSGMLSATPFARRS